jgi:hypothetical protein
VIARQGSQGRGSGLSIAWREQAGLAKPSHTLEVATGGRRDNWNSRSHCFKYAEAEWLRGGGRDQHASPCELLLDVAHPPHERDRIERMHSNPFLKRSSLGPVSNDPHLPTVSPKSRQLPGTERRLRVFLLIESLEDQQHSVRTSPE